MKLLFIAILLILSPFNDLDKIAKINKAKKEAKEAYLAGDYQMANSKYKLLIDSLGVDEEEVQLNFAHTQYQLNDTTNAVKRYQNLTESSNNKISSIAQQQLGQIQFDKKQYEPALEHYKNALRKNPSNQEARYNYELLKKILKEQEDNKKQEQGQDQQNQEPSEFAKQMKKKAEELVLLRKYSEAYNLMQLALQKDKTVSSFNDFINRIKDVVEIK